MILLDTHVLIWLNEGNEKLGPAARSRLLDLEEGGLLVSAITFWEIALLVEKGRLVLDRPLDDWFEQAMQLAAAEIAPITKDIAVTSARLPGSLHSDPADRFIIATSRFANAPLMTADQAILNYAKLGHLSAIEAAR